MDLPLPCLYCASEMPTDDVDSDYCSRVCATRHRVERAARRHAGKTCRLCPSCGRSVPGGLRPGSSGRPRTYCSKACLAGATRRRAAIVRAEKQVVVTCQPCGQDFPRRRADQVHCSQACRSAAWRRSPRLEARDCALPTCGAAFQPLSSRQRCCSEPHGKKLWHVENPGKGYEWNDRRRDAYHRRRAQKKVTTGDRPVLLAEIRERDKNRCHLCSKRVSVKPYPHPMSASLDHIVPLSLDGDHVPENVRLAHLRCNSAKGNRGGNEQLMLIG